MEADPLVDIPEESRREIIAALQAELDVDQPTAEDLIRSAEPFWDAMERAGGLVDSWGGGEFTYLLPRVIAFIRDAV